MEAITAIALFLIFLVLGLFIMAFFTRLAARVVAGFKPGYKIAIGVFIISSVVGMIWGGIFGKCIEPLINAEFAGGARIVSGLALFLVQSAIYGAMFEHPETGPIGIGKGILVEILSGVMVVAVVLGLVFAFPAARKAGWQRFKSDWKQFTAIHAKEEPVLKTNAEAVTVEASQKEAMRLYPALGVAGSAFNKEFLKRHRLYQQEQPEYFQDPTWPLRLAEETKNTLLPTQVPGDGRVNIRH